VVPAGTGETGKVRKPKAEVPNKREMSSQEKSMLKVGLECLPEEKMHNVMQIVQKRNASNPELLGDEIELDIEEMGIDGNAQWSLIGLSTTSTRRSTRADELQ
jgi:hypothetical protein